MRSNWIVSCPTGETVLVDNLSQWCNDNGHDYFKVWNNRDGYRINSASRETLSGKVEGYVHISDAKSGEVLVSKHNSVHFENFADCIALALMDLPEGHIHEMAFGNGASTVSGIGAITYLSPNTSLADSQLYNETYYKVVDTQSPLNLNKDKNKIERKHIAGNVYTDIIVTCTLDYGEPDGQDAFDDTTTFESNGGEYVFDELGLKSYNSVPSGGKLLTHVIFHPVQKSLNRVIEVIYTLRIYMN